MNTDEILYCILWIAIFSMFGLALFYMQQTIEKEQKIDIEYISNFNLNMTGIERVELANKTCQKYYPVNNGINMEKDGCIIHLLKLYNGD